MKAATYHGARDIRVETVPDPHIQESSDIVLKITKSAICGSDLHFYRGRVTIDDGFIVGHEFMGVVEDVGKGVKLFLQRRQSSSLILGKLRGLLKLSKRRSDIMHGWGWMLWLWKRFWRLCWRSSRICKGAICRHNT
jgi:NADPH:quinone reductase-like Zn-dependent oxidoreductase